MKSTIMTQMMKPMMCKIMTITPVSLPDSQERLSQNQELHHAVSEYLC